MQANEEWTAQVKGMLKGELKRRSVTYEQLAHLLNGIGIHDTPKNIRNKISRGGFTAVFFVQCLTAIGCKTISIAEQ